MTKALHTLLCIFAVAAVSAAFARTSSDDFRKWQEVLARIEYHPVKAAADAQAAARDARARGDIPAEAEALFLLSLSRANAGEIDDSDESERRGEALARQTGNMRALAWFIDGRAWNAWHGGKSGEAKVLWEGAIAITKKSGRDDALAWIYSNKGEMLAQDGRAAEAMQTLSEAYTIFERLDDRMGMAYALSRTGEIHGGEDANTEGQEKAAEYFMRASTLLERGTYRVFHATNDTRLGLTLYRRGQLESAKRTLEGALLLARQMQHEMREANVALHLANLYRDLRQYDKALATIENPLLTYEKSGVAFFIVGAHLTRAEILAEHGSKQASMAAVAQALRHLQHIEAPRPRVRYLPRVATVYERLGEPDLAIRQLRAARVADKQLADAISATQSEELQVRFQVQLKDADNARLRAQQEASENQRLAAYLMMTLAIAVTGAVTYFLRKRAAAARTDARHHKALAEAEARANQAKSTFLANMSHELRSPLNAMLGFSRLLIRSPGLPAPARDDLGVIVSSGEHLYSLINEVLNLSKIEAGQMALQEKNFNPYTLLEELEDTFSFPARQKGVQLDINSVPDLPRTVIADAVKLRQVLINLIGNALKFTDCGSVVLQASMTQHDDTSCRLAFAVTDTGAGIAADELDKLGTAFVQAHAGRQAGEGTGLGLAISRGFIELMGGELTLSSELGCGTTVRFEVPVRIARTPQTGCASRTGRRITGLAPGQPPCRILAVDDLPESRQLLTRLLAPLGFEVSEAGNGEEAVAMCAAWQPHLIWMDMRMPVVDGKEATRRIREAGSKAVVVALTASSFEEEREHLMAFGCDDFLRKPFREDELLELIQRHLDVKFLYDDTPPMEQDAPLDTAGLAALPSELKARLREALVLLDVEAVDAAIQAVRLHDAGQARALSWLAERFEYDRIQALLGKADSAREQLERD